MPVVNLAVHFDPHHLGAALARLWTIDGRDLVPTLDAHGDTAQCPLTLEAFSDPVLLANGSVYERRDILKWLDNNNTDPCTNTTLPHKTILKLEPLRMATHEYHLSIRPEQFC
jgi:hypothetical protein